MTKGTDFLSEAERLREIDESKGVITLPLLQGMLLLSERYVYPYDNVYIYMFNLARQYKLFTL